MKYRPATWMALAATLFISVSAFAQEKTALAGALGRVTLDIPAQGLREALREFSSQSGMQLLYRSEDVSTDGLMAPTVEGELTTSDAIKKLLSQTKLSFEFVNARTVRISNPENPLRLKKTSATLPQFANLRLAQSDTSGSPRSDSQGTGRSQGKAGSAEALQSVEIDIPEILVSGSKVLNTDIKRSRDGAQPYVVFERETIQRSAATSVEDFLRQRLPMNTQGESTSQGRGGSLGNVSQINLRGLGTNQTLILIDGRRTTSTVVSGTPFQSNINGIPLAAVERIEVLPTTASGIYGGSATGGVVNIVLRHDFSAAEAQLEYSNAFKSDSKGVKADLTKGFNFGKTNFLIGLSYNDTNGPSLGDRSFLQRGYSRILANNNPAGLLLFGFAPPSGARPNIISADGSPLFGPGTSNITSVPSGYTSSAGLAPLQANAGQFDLDLMDTAQPFGAKVGLLNDYTSKAAMVTLRHEFTPNLQVFMEGTYAREESVHVGNGLSTIGYPVAAFAPNNPFGQDILVTFPEAGSNSLSREVTKIDNSRVVGGLLFRLPAEWSGGAEFSWSSFRDQYTDPLLLSGEEFNVIFDGTVDVLRDTTVNPIDLTAYLLPRTDPAPARSSATDTTLRFAGPVFRLPGGAISLTTLLETRKESFDEASTTSFAGGAPETLVFPSRSQSVDSAYLEARLPFISKLNSKVGVEELELQLAARHDRFEVNGVTSLVAPGQAPVRVTNKNQSTDPTVAIRYRPVQDLMFRMSYGTGFLPPSVQQIVPRNDITRTVVDPRRGNAATVVPGSQILAGGNPELLPEQSKTRSAGFVLSPRALAGFRLSVDYTKIEKSDNIANPFPTIQTLINNESLVPDRIIRGPTAGDPFGVGAIIGVNRTLFNIASAEVTAYDVALDYNSEIASLGSIGFFAAATWQPHYKTQIVANAPIEENVGVAFTNPQRLRANAGVSWARNGLRLDWISRYIHSYLVSEDPFIIASQGDDGRVGSQLYHDFSAAYRFSESGGLEILDDIEVQLVIQNVFNKKPPVDLGNDSFFYSTLGDPRLATYSLRIQKQFH